MIDINSQITIKKIVVLTKEVCIDFEDKESLKILLNTFLEFSLYENKIISLNDYNNIIERDEFYRLKDYAYYLLKFRDYCEREMENSLYKYNQNIKFIKEIIEDLKHKNYLNDESYARYIVEKMSSKKYSKARVIKELEAMEIDENIIIDAISNYNELEILSDKVKHLFNQSYKKKTLDNAKKDVYQKCLYEGFEPSNIIEILDSLFIDNNEVDDHDYLMLENDYKKLKRNSKKDCDSKEFQVKLIRKLSQKGYSYDSIMELIRKDELNND